MLDRICYKKNFLQSVIFRIDFNSNLKFEKLDDDVEFSNIIKKYFKMREKDRIVKQHSFMVRADGKNNKDKVIKNEITNNIERRYSNENGANELVIGQSFFYLRYAKYISYNDLRNAIKDLLDKFYENERIVAQRIGVRYVNIFESDKVILYKNYFTQPVSIILGAKGVGDDKFVLNSSNHIETYTIDDMKLNFRYGLFNESNNLSKNKVNLALDYDCFISELVDDKELILNYVDKAHTNIQHIFERTITDNLRNKVLNHNG
jgi:uncharacterized protein (TIGR04255 family)